MVNRSLTGSKIYLCFHSQFWAYIYKLDTTRPSHSATFFKGLYCISFTAQKEVIFYIISIALWPSLFYHNNIASFMMLWMKGKRIYDKYVIKNKTSFVGRLN